MYNEKYNDKITIYGNKAQIEEAKKKIDKIKPKLTFLKEGEDRLILQNEICDNTKAWILYDGNTVYGKNKLLKQFAMLLKNGMDHLTNDLYEFFHQSCGSIAHYNKQGWIAEYPDLYALKEFFKHNEYGSSVLNDQPDWATDRIVIIKAMQKMLDALSAKIDSQKDADINHKLDVLEEIVKRSRKDPKIARELIEKIFS